MPITEARRVSPRELGLPAEIASLPRRPISPVRIHTPEPTHRFSLPQIGSRGFEGKDVVSLSQLRKSAIESLFDSVPIMEEIAYGRQESHILQGDIVMELFYEPSTRTRVSFQAAVEQLGGRAIIVENPQAFSSVSKGETFDDTIRTLASYGDAIVLRHPEKGKARQAAKVLKQEGLQHGPVPIINAGDGNGEHPTQALLDLYTIFKHKGRLDGLTGVVAGDILNGRTVHSLLRGLALYPDNTVYLLSPDQLRLKPADLNSFRAKGVNLVEITNTKSMPKNADFWYWTRVQKERMPNVSDEEYDRLRTMFVVDNALLSRKAGKNTIIMHPLPRVGEILPEVDRDPRAQYLRSQTRAGMHVRMALVKSVLGR